DNQIRNWRDHARRPDDQDASPFSLDHRRHYRADAANLIDHHRVKILPPRADVRSDRAARGRAATVADQNIRPELAQFPFRGVDRRFILQIDDKSACTVIDLENVSQGLIEPRGFAPADRDFYLFLSQAFCDGEAETARTAQNECRFVRQTEVHARLSTLV